MKRNIFLLLIGLMAAVLVQAQTPETLTNSSIIKMTKAKLADELIIDMIETSTVNFDLGDSALKNLADEGVSPYVIAAMKKAGGYTEPGVVNFKGSGNTAAIGNTTDQKPETEANPVTDQYLPPQKPAETTEQQQPSQKPAETVVQQQPQPQQKPAETTEQQPPQKPAEATVQQQPPQKPAENTEQKPPLQQPVETNKPVNIEALGYITPILKLISFNQKELESFKAEIDAWDQQTRAYINDVNNSLNEMLQIEGRMRDLINADTKAFSPEIISLNKELVASREKYEHSKSEMLSGGDKIVKNLEEVRNERLRNIIKTYGEVSQSIASSDANPATGLSAESVDYPAINTKVETDSHIIYSANMLSWYQNEIEKLYILINDWNPKVSSIVQEDERLSRELGPKKDKLEELKKNAKQNKSEINSLKKEISDLEKERKKLADKMKTESRELSASLKKLTIDDQEAIKERFTDIIENVNYAFQEKLSL